MFVEESVDLLETHAEIVIRDAIAWKRFRLVYRARSTGSVWQELSLEPGQRVIRTSYGMVATGDPRSVLLKFPLDPHHRRAELVFETSERLSPENGFYRVETFNAFLGTSSAPLARRTASVRIESSRPVGLLYSPTHPVQVSHPDPTTALLRLDVGGMASVGKFRFFYSLGPSAPPAAPRAADLVADAPSSRGSEPSTVEREFLEPRRFRPRRRAGLRRLP